VSGNECPHLAKYPPSDMPAPISTVLLEDYQELGLAFLSLGFNSDAAFIKDAPKAPTFALM
jgi:hypothetical protein